MRILTHAPPFKSRKNANHVSSYKYAAHMASVNARSGCFAVATEKRELENYIHHEAVIEFYNSNGSSLSITGPFEDFDDVPTIVAEASYQSSGEGLWDELGDEKRRKKVSKANASLNTGAIKFINVDRLNEVDPNNEVRSWFSKIQEMIMQHDS